MSQNQLNKFEAALYRNIKEYWERLVEGPINIESKEHRAYIKHLELTPQDFKILEILIK